MIPKKSLFYSLCVLLVIALLGNNTNAQCTVENARVSGLPWCESSGVADYFVAVPVVADVNMAGTYDGVVNGVVYGSTSSVVGDSIAFTLNISGPLDGGSKEVIIRSRADFSCADTLNVILPKCPDTCTVSNFIVTDPICNIGGDTYSVTVTWTGLDTSVTIHGGEGASPPTAKTDVMNGNTVFTYPHTQTGSEIVISDSGINVCINNDTIIPFPNPTGPYLLSIVGTVIAPVPCYFLDPCDCDNVHNCFVNSILYFSDTLTVFTLATVDEVTLLTSTNMLATCSPQDTLVDPSVLTMTEPGVFKIPYWKASGTRPSGSLSISTLTTPPVPGSTLILEIPKSTFIACDQGDCPSDLPPPPEDIPTIGEWGIICLVLIGFIIVFIYHQQEAIIKSI